MKREHIERVHLPENLRISCPAAREKHSSLIEAGHRYASLRTFKAHVSNCHGGLAGLDTGERTEYERILREVGEAVTRTMPDYFPADAGGGAGDDVGEGEEESGEAGAPAVNVPPVPSPPAPTSTSLKRTTSVRARGETMSVVPKKSRKREGGEEAERGGRVKISVKGLAQRAVASDARTVAGSSHSRSHIRASPSVSASAHQQPSDASSSSKRRKKKRANRSSSVCALTFDMLLACYS
jgi:hypothetical protein